MNAMKEDTAYSIAELFRYFSDPTRVRILSILLDGEKCVCDISEALSMTQSAVSHQLSLLRTSRLVRTRREGKQVYYSLDDGHVAEILSCGIGHINEQNRGE